MELPLQLNQRLGRLPLVWMLLYLLSILTYAGGHAQPAISTCFPRLSPATILNGGAQMFQIALSPCMCLSDDTSVPAIQSPCRKRINRRRQWQPMTTIASATNYVDKHHGGNVG